MTETDVGERTLSVVLYSVVEVEISVVYLKIYCLPRISSRDSYSLSLREVTHVEHTASQTAFREYDGPDSIDDDITEENFRHAIQYRVDLESAGEICENLERYREFMKFYEMDIRFANRTIERFAIEELACDIRVMQAYYYKYCADLNFSADGKPCRLIPSILQDAWRDLWQN